MTENSLSALLLRSTQISPGEWDGKLVRTLSVIPSEVVRFLRYWMGHTFQ